MTKLNLLSTVDKLKGFGPKRVKQMHKIGVHTIYDLLTYFPFRYNDFNVKNLADEPNGAKVTLRGTVSTPPRVNSYGYKRSRLYFRMLNSDGQNQIWVNFFNQPWLAKRIHYGQIIEVFGRLSLQKRGYTQQFDLNAQKLLKNKKGQQMDAMYPSTKGIHQSTIRRAVKDCYSQCHDLIKNYLPSAIQSRYQLEPETQVIHDLQFPQDDQSEKLARRTAKFNDFFLYQMRLQMIKKGRHGKEGIPIHYDVKKIRKFINNLPFTLTKAQQRCSKEVLSDAYRPAKETRFLQGDVGSGKTIVACILILATISAGYQATLMAPTSVLARQHAKNLSKTFKGWHINIGLLTGDIKPKAKKTLLANIANGNINLVIGTDALIQPDIKFKNMATCIIDEQHKYGVHQRKTLQAKGVNGEANVLEMSATPIPRTMALMSYGDMDLSVIDELPSGRKPIKTKWIRMNQMHSYLKFVKYIMDEGKQVYVVTPLVQQTKGSNDKALDAKTVYSALKYYFPKYKIGLVHGQMDDDKKNKVMNEFEQGKLQMLVATTVVEVGINAQNADLMLIFNPEFMGASSIHQLRGRVGRNHDQAYCLLVTANKISKNSIKRMRIMESTTNGFKVSEADLALRGGGNPLGQSQSGINTGFKVADPLGDRVMLPYAYKEAKAVVDTPHWQKLKANHALVQILRVKKITSKLQQS